MLKLFYPSHDHCNYCSQIDMTKRGGRHRSYRQPLHAFALWQPAIVRVITESEFIKVWYSVSSSNPTQTCNVAEKRKSQSQRNIIELGCSFYWNAFYRFHFASLFKYYDAYTHTENHWIVTDEHEFEEVPESGMTVCEWELKKKTFINVFSLSREGEVVAIAFCCSQLKSG